MNFSFARRSAFSFLINVPFHPQQSFYFVFPQNAMEAKLAAETTLDSEFGKGT